MDCRAVFFASLAALVVVGDAAAQALPVGPPRAPAGLAAPEPVRQMEALVITAERVLAADSAGPQEIDAYDSQDIDSSGAFSVAEFLGNLPPADEGAPVLVLIDGRPTYLNPNSLPIGMIAGIEVSDEGSMPQYGAFNGGGRIINIRLKKNYASREIGARFAGSFAGGGSSRSLRFSGAVNRGDLRMIYGVEVTEDRPLLASDRDFSREQDWSDRGGRDLRLPWGAPAVVASRSGPLAGFPDGTEVVLVPAGTSGTGLAREDFLPADPALGAGPENQRRFNTSAYRWLASPSRGRSLNLGFTYTFNEYLQVSLTGSHSLTKSERLGAPPVTPVSNATRVPAHLNPFGQDVAVGLVHLGFGATRRDSQSERDQFGLEVNGRLPAEWRWEANAGYRLGRSRQVGAELDPAKLSAALRAEDPAQRFNPFVDDTEFDTNAHLYPSLTSWRRGGDRSVSSELGISARGPTFRLPGGPAQLRLGAELDESTRERLTTRDLGDEPELSRRRSFNREVSSHLSLPLVEARQGRAWARRLEAQLSSQLSRGNDGSRERTVETGMVWAPGRSLSFRARYEREVETPSPETTAGSDLLLGESLVDSRRDGETLTGVRAFTRETVNAEPELSGRYSFGATLEPRWVPGLRLSVSYRLSTQERMFEDDLDPQEVIYNEAALGDRVIRAAPTPVDLANGRPGAIVAIDLTPGNTGRSERGQLDYEISYRPKENRSGQWRFSASVDQFLQNTYEVLPGVPFIAEGGNASRPRLRWNGQLAWNRSSWNASVRMRHVGAVTGTPGAHNGVAASTIVDFSAGYRWRLAGADRRRRDVRLGVGIGNVFDRDPPFADNVNGYRGGSPLGRTYSLSASVEL